MLRWTEDRLRSRISPAGRQEAFIVPPGCISIVARSHSFLHFNQKNETRRAMLLPMFSLCEDCAYTAQRGLDLTVAWAMAKEKEGGDRGGAVDGWGKAATATGARRHDQKSPVPSKRFHSCCCAADAVRARCRAFLACRRLVPCSDLISMYISHSATISDTALCRSVCAGGTRRFIRPAYVPVHDKNTITLAIRKSKE